MGKVRVYERVSCDQERESNQTMSQSYGGRGRKPERPSRGGQPYGQEPQYGQDANYIEPVEPNLELTGHEKPDLPAQTNNWAPRKPTGSRRGKSQPDIEIAKVEPTKRMVALMFDCMAWYFLSMILTVLPFINHLVTLSSAWMIFLLVRDCLFAGRGVGKNLMGLQVIDAKTGAPCSLRQSVLRNIIILAPFAVLQLIGVILTFVRIPAVNEVVKSIVDVVGISEVVKSIVGVVGMIYLAVVLPVECYRAYTREDSRRLGDTWAGTAIVEAPMDFSNPFSK
jgi:uncharacterized RDD family membrane protein YckC